MNKAKKSIWVIPGQKPYVSSHPTPNVTPRLGFRAPGRPKIYSWFKSPSSSYFSFLGLGKFLLWLLVPVVFVSFSKTAHCMHRGGKEVTKVVEKGVRHSHLRSTPPGPRGAHPRDGHPKIIQDICNQSECEKKNCPAPCGKILREVDIGNHTHRAPRDNVTRGEIHDSATNTDIILEPQASAQSFPAGTFPTDAALSQVTQRHNNEIHEHIDKD